MDALMGLLMGAEEFLYDENMFIYVQKVNQSKYLLPLVIQDHSMVPKQLRSEDWIINYNDIQFFQLFRLSKSSVEQLEQVIGTEDKHRILYKKYSGGHYPIDIRTQILVFLWYMGTQDTLLGIGTKFNMSRTSVMKIVNKLLYFILKLKKTYIKFPKREAELKKVQEGFKRYPGVVGAIDGTHIYVTVSQSQQDSYIDRYRRHSINAMVICDANRLILYCFVGFPGSAHDSRVFQNSSFFKTIEQHGPNHLFLDDTKYHLIGDSAFPLHTWLMTPYKDFNNLTAAEKKHNFRLSSDRVVVEHTIGQVKLRWRRLTHIHTYNICKAIEISTAAFVLHNFCLLLKDTWPETPTVLPNVESNTTAAIQQEARHKRDRIAQSFLNL